jgi:hypothetical protein
MRAISLRAGVLGLLCAAVLVMPACSSSDEPASSEQSQLAQAVDGTWTLKLDHTRLDLPGFLRGGPMYMQDMPVSQSGHRISSSFTDKWSNNVSMTGTMMGGMYFNAYWDLVTPGGRYMRWRSFGNLNQVWNPQMIDGWFVLLFDSWFRNTGTAEIGFWATVNPGSLPVGIPDGVSEDEAETIRNCPGIDIVFTMDTSGSMDDEAAALCTAISDVRSTLLQLGLSGSNLRVKILGITDTGFSSDFACLEDTVVNLYGAQVPGDLPTNLGQLNSSEDWGSSVAVVAQNHPWATGFVRIVVPVSDEGPENGGGEFTCNQDDTMSIDNAIMIAQATNVIASPIVAALNQTIDPQSCILAEATRLANATGGSVQQSTDPSLDIGQAIFDLIVEACEEVQPASR